MRVNPPDPLEAYLGEVKKKLTGLRASEVEEVVRELRSHVLDRVATGEANLESALARLGEPLEVARLNLAARGVSPDDRGRSPTEELWARLRKGWCLVRIAFASCLGYGVALSCALLLLAKLIAPKRFGLWLIPDPTGDLSFSLGGSTPHFAGHDILGFWLIPATLIVAASSSWLTYRFHSRALHQFAVEPSETDQRL